jgi:NADH-quinone oxidoreductase subunit J
MVLLSNNPIQSLLNLILVFGVSSMLFMILGAEFLSYVIFIVYIGAIAVLFLFVIMLLNIKIVELRSLYLRYMFISFTIIVFFFFELFFSFYLKFYTFEYKIYFLNWINFLDYKGNLYLIASVIYSNYNILLFLVAIALFISMFGSIVLLVNWKENKINYYNNLFFYSEIKNKLFIKTKKGRY